MKKTLFTLNIGNYAPEITELTYPLLRRYSQKIGADFRIITERKFPDNDIEYEKLQIYELGKGNDWNIYIDSDAVVHPELFDISIYLPKNTVMHHAIDPADLRWTFDEYFLRDGRNIASCNWFAMASDLCLDLWRPPDDLNEGQIIKRICPNNAERLAGVQAQHLVSDFICSRNIARYGLQVMTFVDLLKKLGREKSGYFFHLYMTPNDEKRARIVEVMKQWKLL